MKLARTYLTSEEMIYVVSTLSEIEDTLQRDIVRIGIVAQLLCEDIGEFEDCNNLYDLYMKSELDFTLQVKNYVDIDLYLEDYFGTTATIKSTLDNLSAKLIDGVNEETLLKAVAELKEVIPNAQTETIQK